MQAFHETFKAVYGDRWESLYNTLAGLRNYAALFNLFANSQDVQEVLSRCQDQSPTNIAELFTKFPFFSTPALVPKELHERPFSRPEYDNFNVKSHYLLDPASLLVVEALNLQASDNVLDLCAAPGGKSVAIVMRLRQLLGNDQCSDSPTVCCNEVDPDRRRRLRNVLKEYLPDTNPVDVTTTKIDVTSNQEFDTTFTKIMIDAPCSSERHLIHNSLVTKDWSPKLSPNAAKKQVKLVLASLSCLEVGGRLVYSTCSINPLENDGVISSVLKKYKGLKVTRKPLEWGEPTKYGWMILPDHTPFLGCGPIYYCVLVKEE